MSDENEIKDEMIAISFVRNNSIKDESVCKNITKIIYTYYHVVMKETFKLCSEDYQISEEGMKLLKMSLNASIAYGSEVIPSMDGEIYQWSFKIGLNYRTMAIGIDETKYIRKDKGHFGDKKLESTSYALWSNGERDRWEIEETITDGNAPTFTSEDSVCMILDLHSKELCYKINDGEKYVAFTDIAVGININYCLGVYIARYNNSMQLLNCARL
eukprot:289438_1